MKKKVISLTVILALFGSLCGSSFAANIPLDAELTPDFVYVSTEHLSPEEQAMLDTFSGMGIDELNLFISNNVAKLKNSNQPRNDITTSELKLLWVAAAQAAKLAGYPLAASLVESSVWNIDYDEFNGPFSTAIKASTAYHNWQKQMSMTSIAFEKNDNADLFFSLHLANIRNGSSSSQGAVVYVSDVFDFAFVTDMDSIFTTIINDWAWLCQQTSVLNPIDVNIRFNA